MSRTDLHAVSGSQSADFSSTIAAPYPARHARDPGHRIEAGKAATIPPAGQARLANERDSSAPRASALTGAELRLLPLLSTHLGHIKPASTYWYLQAAPELLALAGERLERHLQGAGR